QVFRLTFEVLEGRRGPRQLEQLMAPDLVAKVITLSREYAGNRSRSTARLKRVHVQQVTPRAAEACATVERNDRIHAVAARMEMGRNGWRCTALRIG
ncbi:MAG: Rv3235 family protein, partial [Mycobacteriaceae bacterium]